MPRAGLRAQKMFDRGNTRRPARVVCSRAAYRVLGLRGWRPARSLCGVALTVPPQPVPGRVPLEIRARRAMIPPDEQRTAGEELHERPPRPGPSRCWAHPTPASRRWSTGCAALEGQPQPAGGAGRDAGLRASPISANAGRRSTRPGSIEFLHVASDALLAADAAVICVAPDPAAAVLAAPYLHAVEAAGTPAMIFINRIDEATGRVRDIVAALQDYAAHPIVLRQIPIREGDRVVGAVDLVSERAWAYREGEPSQLVEIPAGTARARARGARRDARAPVRVRRLAARGADRGPDAAERRGLRALRPGARREPGDGGADRLGGCTATASSG